MGLPLITFNFLPDLRYHQLSVSVLFSKHSLLLAPLRLVLRQKTQVSSPRWCYLRKRQPLPPLSLSGMGVVFKDKLLNDVYASLSVPESD